MGEEGGAEEDFRGQVVRVELADVEEGRGAGVVDGEDLGGACEGSEWGKRREREARTIFGGVDDVPCGSLGEESGHEVVVGSVAVQERRKRDGCRRRGGGEEEVAGEDDEVGLSSELAATRRGSYDQTHLDKTSFSSPPYHRHSPVPSNLLRHLLQVDLGRGGGGRARSCRPA